MNTILVLYDLMAPGKDYTRLHDYLKSFSNWAHPLNSVYLVKTSMTASQVRDGVRQHTDTNDRTFILNVTGDNWASWNLTQEVATWLRDSF